jgi:glycogen synthase
MVGPMPTNAATPKADYLFEVSWEVCNKVGGINTVLKSKAALMTARYKNYVMVGPYIERNAAVEFEEHEAPSPMREALAELARQGLPCRYGVWQTKGEPHVILIDFSSLIASKNQLKGQLWESFRIDSYGSSWDYEEPIVFSAAVAQLLLAFERQVSGKKVVAHFHEWMTGAALLFLKQAKSGIKTVFTTHATMLGRAICGAGGLLYEMLDTMDPMQEAYRSGVAAKHLTERACASTCDVFTTVSEITGIEAEKILGRKPDVLLLNGLDISKFPTFEETSIKHITCREKLRSFLSYHFFPYYVFPLEHNLIFFITGRYEYHNKGIDLTIQALGRLNERMKQDNDVRTVTAFFWIPIENTGVKVELLENKNYYHHIKAYIQYNEDEILKKVFYDFLAQRDLTGETLFTKEFLKEMRKDLLQFKRQGNPPLCTHQLTDNGNNELITALYAAGLDNRADDKVKVVVVPVYLDGNDGLINLPYYDAIAGTHLGLFPSYYEPWGYTPLETSAMGVSSVTTDLAGFGRFIEPHLPTKDPGIRVLDRFKIPWAQIVDNFSTMLYDFTMLSHADRVQNKIAAKHLTELCDWENFIEFYIEAHNRALEKK